MTPADLPDHLQRHVQATPGCWWWTGPASTAYRLDGPQRRAVVRYRDASGWHTTTAARLVLQHVLGRTLERAELVLHSCDQALCVRPTHLRVGTARENSADARDRGRLRPGGKRPQPVSNHGDKWPG